MQLEHCLLILVAILYAYEKLERAIENRAYRAERRELYNRISAGSLADYASCKPLVEPTKPKVQTPPVEDDDGWVEPVVLPGDSLSMADAQAAFNKIKSGNA
jgi:hypothetical protein